MTRQNTMRLYEIKNLLVAWLVSLTPGSGDLLKDLALSAQKGRDVKLLENDVAKILAILRQIAPSESKAVIDSGANISYEFKENFILTTLRNQDIGINSLVRFLTEWRTDKFKEFKSLPSLHQLDFVELFLVVFHHHSFFRDDLDQINTECPNIEQIEIYHDVIDIVRRTMFDCEYDNVSPRIMGNIYFLTSFLYRRVGNYPKELRLLLLSVNERMKLGYDLRSGFIQMDGLFTICEYSFLTLYVAIAAALKNCGLDDLAIKHIDDFQLFGVEVEESHLHFLQESRDFLNKAITSVS